MTSETICCPYCNAYVTIPDVAPPARVSCPRCGEAFPYRPAGAADEGTAWDRPQAEEPVHDPSAGLPEGPRRSNRSLALVIVGAMAAIAACALGFALMTRPLRRSHDPVLAEGTALGYVPRDANVVASVQVNEVLREPAGKELLKLLQLSPHEGATEPLERWTGLKLEDIDSAALGLRLTGEPYRTVLILQTRRPYAPQQVQSALKAGRPFEYGTRILYRISPEGLPFQTLWCAASNVIVLAMAQEDFDAVPDTPAIGTDALPPPLKATVDDQLVKAGQVWLAGQTDNWDKIGMFLGPRSRLSRKDRDALAKVRTLGLALRFDKEVALKVVLNCTDASAAKGLEPSLRAWGKVLPAFSARRSDARLTVGAKAGLTLIRQALEQAAPGRGR
ncbi:MAG TPA: hypothetical protein VG013_16740 [Gemmataceae bacterium]|nr:hypothetical protein [Gemmataceae bacterium]